MHKTRILWTTNVTFPYPAKRLGRESGVYGGWMIALFDRVSRDDGYEFAVAATYNGKELKKYRNGNTIYYMVPCRSDVLYDRSQEKYWRRVVDEFKPDLVHAHGTEYAHNLALQNACPNVKVLVSIQGIMAECAKYCLAGIPVSQYIKNSFLTTPIVGSAIIGKLLYEKRSTYEKKILEKCTAITGRTLWDKKHSLEIAGRHKPYFVCNEILRDGFYSANWDEQKMESHSIYISQASYPIKGFHTVIPVISMLSKKYPDLKVYIAGKNNIINGSPFKQTEYSKILRKLIKKYDVEKFLVFTGPLREDEVLRKMLSSNLYLQCSAIENSPNSLGEAMLIGMPCVASDVGGTKDLLVDKKEGLLYHFGNTKELFECIDAVFSNNDLALSFGKNAKKHAILTHDREKNARTMLDIYKKILQSGII